MALPFTIEDVSHSENFSVHQAAVGLVPLMTEDVYICEKTVKIN